MLALHAIWDSTQLHLWAESSDLPATVPKRRGRQPKSPPLRPHPFSLNNESLEEAVGRVSGSLIAQNVESGALTVLLPFAPNGPLSSPELIRENEGSQEKAAGLAQWKVATLILPPAIAQDLLLSLPNRPPHGIAFGASLRFWAEVAKFSLELITRQHFLPGIRENRAGKSAHFRAVWEVVLDEEGAEKLQLLSGAMPPICRAFIPPEEEETGSPSELVLNFLHRTVDTFVRGCLSSVTILPLRRGRPPKVVPLPELWLKALCSDDPAIHAPAKEATTFSKEIKTWLRQIQPADRTAPFRTCFRLEPPETEDIFTAKTRRRRQTWWVSFHLQANDDRSLLVPAEKVWQTRSGILTFLKRRFENPQERLLADLGKTARLFPAIEESLKTASPVGLALDTNGAYTFLRQSAPLLEQSGFGVLLPSWWQKPAVRLGVKLKVKPKPESNTTGAGLMGVGGIVNYNWQVALGDQTLSPEEFEKLAALKVPLVRVRGQWVELNPAEIEAAIAFFKERHSEGEMALSEAMRLGLGQERSEVGLPVVGIEAAGWIEDLLNRVSGDLKITVLKSPRTFRGRLRPYQIKGFSWLVFLKQFGFGACLADDMGLGKTIQFIALMLQERITRRQKLKPTLLICPTSIVGNWHREIERFGPSLKVMIHHGTDRLSGRAFEKKVKKHDLVISTYALGHRDKELFSAVHWQCVALDEAQNIKNPAAKQTQAIRKIRANYRVALTGTPVENRLSELWSIMEFLNPGYLGSAKDFRTRFAVPIERYRNRGQAETLKHLIQPFVLRRMKTDPTIINDLPEKMEMKVFCNLTGEQASLYQAVVDEMMEKIEDSEGIERKGLVLSTLMKLKQVCNHPAQFVRDRSTLPGRSGKLTRLVEMLEEVLEEDNKALIFTQFAEMGVMLRHHLQEATGVETLFLHGGTPRKQRDRMVQRFQADRHGPPLFVLSLKAGGLGLNLTAANQVFHFDRWWNPAVENQATDRAFRIGQKKNVQVYKFVCIGTLEERIDQMIEQKKELAESIIGTGEAWLTEMSTEQLKEIFTLSREAVGE